MKNIFDEVNSLDKRAYEEFFLSEDILMEHASSKMARFIKKKFDKKSKVLIVCGPGNNGADGIALARLLYKSFDVRLYIPFELKSKMAKLQEKRALSLGIKQAKKLKKCDLVVDCLFGSGLSKSLDELSISLINKLNKLKAYKLSCDIPSGINSLGQIHKTAFKADTTITMGALKTALFSDSAKDYVGIIKIANLGISKKLYERSSNKFLLSKKALKLPLRNKENSHKGSFGHLNVVVGCKSGAGIIASNAAFSFGCGLVSVLSHENITLPEHIMKEHNVSSNCTAIAIGMGLGNYELKEIKKILSLDIPMILDADLFYEDIILEVLNKDIVLTPHPKEFVSLLRLTKIANITIEELQENRFYYVNKFCEHFPNLTLLLKGSNVLIGKNDKIYVNSFGNASLAKGGSGDVLSGLIGSLLAQGYTSLEASISASLAHSLAAKEYTKNNYSLSPKELIKRIKKL